MLSDHDIRRLTAVLASKKDLEKVHEEISAFRETMDALVTSIDGLAKVIDELQIEYSAIKVQMNRHERWIRQIASKAGVSLKV